MGCRAGYVVAGSKGARYPCAPVGIGWDGDVESGPDDAGPVGHGAHAEALVILPVVRDTGAVVLNPESDVLRVAGEADGDGGGVPVFYGIADGLLSDPIEVQRTTFVVDQRISFFYERARDTKEPLGIPCHAAQGGYQAARLDIDRDEASGQSAGVLIGLLDQGPFNWVHVCLLVKAGSAPSVVPFLWKPLSPSHRQPSAAKRRR